METEAEPYRDKDHCGRFALSRRCNSMRTSPTSANLLEKKIRQFQDVTGFPVPAEDDCENTRKVERRNRVGR
jgi:hypothetical protein